MRRELGALGLVGSLIVALAGVTVAVAPDATPSQAERGPADIAVLPIPPAAPTSPAHTAPLEDGWRIRVPRLGIDLPLAEGDLVRDMVDQATPLGAAFRMPWSMLPGEGGNTYVYAHARRGMFLSLWQARIGDGVTLVRPDGSLLRYRVVEVVPRVPADDLTYFQPTSEERLTLQTSSGPKASDPRFVVLAAPVAP